MRIKLKKYNSKEDLYIGDIINEYGEYIGGIEFYFKNDILYLENIRKCTTRKRILEDVIIYLKDKFELQGIICLPLPQYINYYKSLGFTKYKQVGEDTYYELIF